MVCSFGHRVRIYILVFHQGLALILDFHQVFTSILAFGVLYTVTWMNRDH